MPQMAVSSEEVQHEYFITSFFILAVLQLTNTTSKLRASYTVADLESFYFLL